MTDPLQRQRPDEIPSKTEGFTLWDQTRAQAHVKASERIEKRYGRILQLLGDHGPLAIFEVANLMNVGDNQISGRFSEMVNQKLIEKAGLRRRKGETGCWAECYRLVEKRTERKGLP